jgi:hypothetical protein
MLIGLVPLLAIPLSFLGLGVGLMALVLPIGVSVIMVLKPRR